MSEISEIIDTLEERIEKLFAKIDFLEARNAQLQDALRLTENLNQSQHQELKTLKSEYDALKIANSLLGSEEYKREVKLKINSLLREIDYCIQQLSD